MMKFILTILLSSLSILMYAQNLSVSFITSVSDLSLSECGYADTLFIEVENTGTFTISNLVLSDTLATGIRYMNYASGGPITAVDDTDPSTPILSLSDLLAGDKDTIALLVMSECDADNLSSFVDAIHATYDENGSSYTSDYTSADYVSGIYSPNLIMTANGSINFPSGKIGDGYCRSYDIINTGQNSTLDSVTFVLEYQTGLTFDSLKIDGVTVTPTIIGDSIIYSFQADLRDNTAFPGDVITIEECFTFSDCLDPSSTTSEAKTFWGCDGTSCQNRVLNPSVQHASGVPNLVMTHTRNDGCYGGYDTLNFVVRNTGNEMATEIELNVMEAYSTVYTYQISNMVSYLDTTASNMTVQLGQGGTPVQTPLTGYTLSTYTRSAWGGANVPWEVTVSSPVNLRPGDTLFFQMLAVRPCWSSNDCGTKRLGSHGDLNYKKACSSASYGLLSRVGAGAEALGSGNFIDGPTDMGNGDTAKFSMCFAAGSNNGFDKDLVNGYMKFEVELPPSLCWDYDSSQLDLFSLASTDTDSWDSLFYDTAGMNNTLNIFYNYQNAISRSNRSNYCIAPKMILDCSKPGAVGGANDFKWRVLDDFKPNCATSCIAPTQCEQVWTYIAHCPAPCPRGGFLPERALISRVNLDQPDNDQNGLPDGSGSLDMNSIEWDKVTARDTFNLFYNGNIIRGTQSPPQFDYGYGEVEIPTIGNLTTYLGSEVQIWDASAGTTFTITTVPASAVTSGGNRVYTLNYSTNNGASNWPAGYYFDDGDSIVINARFVFNPNRVSTNDYVNAVTNHFYVSHLANPSNDTAKYSCDRWGAKLKTTDAYHTRTSTMPSTFTSCNSKLMALNGYLSIGDCCSNYSTSIHFPKEYRAYAIIDSMSFVVPAGWVVDSAYLEFRRGTQVGNHVLQYKYGQTPGRISGDTLTYYVYNQYTTHGGDIVPSRGGYFVRLWMAIRPTCEVPSNVNMAGRYRVFHSGINSWAGLNSAPAYANTGNLRYRAPQLTIDNFGSVTTNGDSRVVSWDVKLQNNDASAISPFNWISWQQGGGITIDSILDISSGTTLSASNEVYEAGTISAGGAPGSKNYKVYATYSNCQQDTVWMYAGWDCGDYPDHKDSVTCNIDSTPLVMVPLYPVLNSTIVSATANPVNLCDTFEYTLSVRQVDQARSYNNYVDLTIPTGISIVADSSWVEYQGDLVKDYFNPINISGNIWRFWVDSNHSTIGLNGISVFAEAPDNEYYLHVELATNCDYVSGSNLRFTAGGEAPCGDVIPSVTEFQPITIAGLPSANNYIPVLDLGLDSIYGCVDTVDVHAAWENFELVSTATGDEYVLTLPIGFTYVPNSSVFTKNAFNATEPILSTLGNQEVITWIAGSSIPANDSSVWDFQLAPSNNCVCAELDFQVSINSETSLSCGSSSCTIGFQNNTTADTAAMIKPIIGISSNNIEIITDTLVGVSDTARVIINMFNNGLVSSVGYTVQLYEDVNADGMLDAGDVLNGTSVGSAIPASGGVSDTLDFLAPNGTLACPMLIELTFDCDCANDSIISIGNCSVTPVPVELTYFEIENIQNKEAILRWQTASEIDNDKFVVERRSQFEADFIVLGSVEGAGNSQSLVDYSFADDISRLPVGVYHYRLRQIDYSLEETLSEVRSITKENDLAVVVYPNPARTSITVYADFDKAEFQLTDASGKLISNGMFEGKKDKIDLIECSNGMYYLTVRDVDSQVGQVFKVTVIR